jgi:hypothetical protein
MHRVLESYSPRASCGPASAGSWNDLLLCLLGQAQVRAYVTSGLGRLLTRTRSSLMIEKSAPRLYQRLIMRCSLSPITSAGGPRSLCIPSGVCCGGRATAPPNCKLEQRSKADIRHGPAYGADPTFRNHQLPADVSPHHKPGLRQQQSIRYRDMGSITQEPTPSIGAASILCRRRDRRHLPDLGQ